jgi:hypothetical protein
MVNHANQLAGSMDKRDAVWILKILHKGGHRLNPDDIYAWALANGWPSRGAARLKEYAERIGAGRTVQAGMPNPFRPDMLERWRAEATGNDA